MYQSIKKKNLKRTNFFPCIHFSIVPKNLSQMNENYQLWNAKLLHIQQFTDVGCKMRLGNKRQVHPKLGIIATFYYLY